MQFNLNCNSFFLYNRFTYEIQEEMWKTHMTNKIIYCPWEIYTLTMNKMFIWARKIMRMKIASTMWDSWLSRPNVEMTFDTCLLLTLRCFQLIFWMPKHNFHAGSDCVSSNVRLLLCDTISIKTNKINISIHYLHRRKWEPILPYGTIL